MTLKDKLFGSKKFDSLKFGLSAGITLGIFLMFATLLALGNIPGFGGFCNVVASFYGPWGYSISLPGSLIGGLYGFGDGFIVAFVFAFVYNKLIKL